jgi:hypothetical protein
MEQSDHPPARTGAEFLKARRICLEEAIIVRIEGYQPA